MGNKKYTVNVWISVCIYSIYIQLYNLICNGDRAENNKKPNIIIIIQWDDNNLGK